MQEPGQLDDAETDFFSSIQSLLSRRNLVLPRRIRTICAVDAAYRGNRVVAVATEFIEGRKAMQGLHDGHCTFPYESGLFYLREGPAAVAAVKALRRRPQLICFDAHGAAHPRSAGLATICGMVLGIPSIGIAKSLLVGEVIGRQPGRGPIRYEGKQVGVAADSEFGLRYWSPGYSVSLRELRTLIDEHGPACIRAMAESHSLARETVRQPKD